MFSRDVLNALMPEGSFWTPATDDYYDKLLSGIAENSEAVRLDMKALRYLRDPLRTPILSDLEKEYGVIPLPGATEAERRQKLFLKKYRRNVKPTYEKLEALLQESGFDVYVHANSPAVDPNIFLTQAFYLMCGELLPGGNNPECGEPEAYCAAIGGELLVNGDVYKQTLRYSALCGEDWVQCDEPDAQAGQSEGISTNETIQYTIPTNAGYWPMIFFVGGPATRDPVTGALTDIEIAQIPVARKQEFKSLILRKKVMPSWAALICVYT